MDDGGWKGFLESLLRILWHGDVSEAGHANDFQGFVVFSHLDIDNPMSSWDCMLSSSKADVFCSRTRHDKKKRAVHSAGG